MPEGPGKLLLSSLDCRNYTNQQANNQPKYPTTV